jgi:hypothetical protein
LLKAIANNEATDIPSKTLYNAHVSLENMLLDTNNLKLPI